MVNETQIKSYLADVNWQPPFLVPVNQGKITAQLFRIDRS